MLEEVAEWCNCRIEIINPTEYFSYDEKKHKTNKQIKEFYMNKIRKCDLVICNLNGTDFSIGTAQEIQFARCSSVPIIGFGTKDVYPWISEVDCEVTFDEMSEAVDYVRDYYMR